MAATGSEQKELLALIHQHLVQTGYEKAAKELLEQSGQKTFSLPPVSLRDIFIQWKRTSSQAPKRKADDINRGTPAKIRVPDPKSSSESSEEEEEANVIKTNLPVNNSSMAKAESSSEDEDSSSEEEAVAEKTVKNPVTINKTDFLQLAAQKANSFPGKGVATAAVQAKGRQNKAAPSKPPPPQTVARAGQNKARSGKEGPTSQPPVVAGQNTIQAATPKKAVNSESSSSSSESEEEETPAVVKTPLPKPAPQKAESSSEDSSDDSDSEEETNAATVQVKPAAQSAQVNTTLAKRVPAAPVPSKGNAAKVSPAKATANQTRAASGVAARSTKPTDSSETSDSSGSEEEGPLSVAQSSGKSQAIIASVKNAPSSLPSNKAVSPPTPLKQTPKPSVTTLAKLPPPTKAVGSAKKAESSESSESSSGSEDEATLIPVSQKNLQAPQPPTGAKQNWADKPGTSVKAASSALKGKEVTSESSSSSDSEEETVPAAPRLPPPSAKANAVTQPTRATKPQPPAGSLPKAQASEDSSQDSSDESDSEEDKVFTQKPVQVTQKPAPTAVKAPTAKSAGATSGKAGNAQPAGKGTASLAKSAAASFQKASESSETDSSDSSEGKDPGKTTKQPPIHPFFRQMASKGAISSGKANSSSADSISNKCQGTAAITVGKVEQSPSKKAKLGQALPAKPTGIFAQKEDLGSSSSSDSEEEVKAAALAAAKQIPQLADTTQKRVIKEPESSSEESSDEDQETSQSILKGFSGHLKVPTSTVAKSAVPVLSKQGSGKAGIPVIGALAKVSGKASPGDSSSSDSSDSDTDIEETAGAKAEISSLPSSGKEMVAAKTSKGAGAEKREPGIKSKAPTTTKAKAQSNGKAKATAAIQLTLPLSAKAYPAGGSSDSKEEAFPHVPGAGAPEVTPVVALKTPKTAKPSKAGAKEKPPKKRKLAAEDAGVGEPKTKKLQLQSDPQKLAKKKKKMKKKSKTPSSTKTPKEKDGKEKKSKKKKKSKKLASLTENESQKKKKKKKKTGDLGVSIGSIA